MTWNSPFAFFLLIPLFLFFIYLYTFSRKKKGAFLYSHLKLLSGKGATFRTSLAFLPNLLKGGALIFVIIALARPQTTKQMSHQSQKGVDIMIVMDISLSMLIQDMNDKTRLEASKEVVLDFIDGRSNDRMGLIIFSGESFTKVPLTFDHELLKKHIQAIKPLRSITPGTAIGVALANATARLKHSPPESRTMIFLTDGENNTGFIDPETALNLTYNNKIKVYTIGLGSRDGSFRIQYEDQDARGRKFYQRGIVNSRINKKLLSEIAKKTGGEFFIAKNLYSLRDIFKKIDKLETYEIQINKWTQYNEHFINFLLTGFFLYFLSVILSLTVFFRGI